VSDHPSQLAGVVATAQFEQYERANAFINEGLIRCDAPADPNHRSRRDWMRELLPQIGHPEQSYPAIHVAGTSGKGSVATMIANILWASGLRTGLHVSPYVQLATEKLWIDGRYASASEYTALVDWFRPIADQVRGPYAPLHGLASVALCLEHFRRRAVDVAVMEAGVGGRRDLTTVVDTRVAVITNVGRDHEKTLGPTLADIAWHKAGIIRPGCRAVIFARTSADPLVKAARQAAHEAAAQLRIVTPDQVSIQHESSDFASISFSGRRLRLHNARLALRGSVQAANAALALAACEEFDPEGRWVNAATARQGLEAARLPARQELVPASGHSPAQAGGDCPTRPLPCPVLLDGAHNTDKLQGVVGAHLAPDASAACISSTARYMASRATAPWKGSRNGSTPWSSPSRASMAKPLALQRSWRRIGRATRDSRSTWSKTPWPR
jgi:dihydrofolate synthase/folylpolyglutamate synthase